MTGTSLTNRAAVGLSWSTLSTAVLVVANLGYTATVSRLLEPAAFGLVAMANLVVLFAQYFARMGLASAVVQKPELSDDEIRASSTAGIVVGLVCTVGVWFLAPAVGGLFRTPDLVPVLRGLGLSFLFVGWSMTGLGLLRREMRFRALAGLSVVSYVGGYLVVGVGLALSGAGVWSLVAAAVSSSVIQAVSQYAVLRHPLRPVLRWAPYRSVCGYGTTLSAAHLLDYVGGNLDTFTVARIADAAVVGQYSRGYYLVFQPLANYLSAALNAVVFAALSRVQQDLARLRRAYLSVATLGALLVFPLAAGMAVSAPELVEVVLGPQWGSVAGLVPWFALAGACHVASQLSQSLAEARAWLRRSLVVQVAYLVVLAALLLVALGFRARGIWVIGAAVAGAEAMRYLGYLALVRKDLDLPWAWFLRAHAPAALATTAVALAVAVPGRLLAGAPSVAVLAADLVAGALALALSVRLGPTSSVRADLWHRVGSAGLLGAGPGRRRRLAALVLGPDRPVPTEVGP